MWTLKNDKGEYIPATADNIINALESGTNRRISEEEERATEKRYLEQNGIIVKCYWDGKHNIIDLTPDYKE
jgi:hypothetical protein